MSSSATGNRFLRHRRRRVAFLIAATVLSLLIPLLMVYFSSCARTQAIFDSNAAIVPGHATRVRSDSRRP
jgi:uncharacterized membrane protein YukC